MKKLAVILAAALLMSGCAGDTGDTSEPTSKESGDSMTDSIIDTVIDESTVPSLAVVYADEFTIGGAVSTWQINDEKYRQFICQQYNSITFENEFKPEAVLDRDETLSDIDKYREAPAVKLEQLRTLLDFARDNGIAVRGHTLVWHSQTPEWIFYTDYDTEGELCDRELMLKRMENYIKTIFEWTDENYPGLIYAWDVVNEAIADEGGMRESLWYQTIGEDYVERAFEYARRYAPEGVKLFYNDYNAWQAKKSLEIIEMLKPVAESGNIDGVGMQSHLAVGVSPDLYMSAMKRYVTELNLSEIQITELDIAVDQSSDPLEKQGEYVERFMRAVLMGKAEGMPITNVTIWGTTDDLSWKSADKPLLFNGDFSPKPAFDGFVAAKNGQ